MKRISGDAVIVGYDRASVRRRRPGSGTRGRTLSLMGPWRGALRHGYMIYARCPYTAGQYYSWSWVGADRVGPGWGPRR